MAYLLKLCYAFEHKLAKCLKIRRFYETINMQKREKENADDIKALLKKIGLGASECRNTLGELFQRWGVQ